MLQVHAGNGQGILDRGRPSLILKLLHTYKIEKSTLAAPSFTCASVLNIWCFATLLLLYLRQLKGLVTCWLPLVTCHWYVNGNHFTNMQTSLPAGKLTGSHWHAIRSHRQQENGKNREKKQTQSQMKQQVVVSRAAIAHQATTARAPSRRVALLHGPICLASTLGLQSFHTCVNCVKCVNFNFQKEHNSQVLVLLS